MVATVGELYEWMQGPLMDHFVCDEPPDATASRAGVNRELCYLPDGLFVGDNLIELRTLRVKVPDGPSPLKYFTSNEVGVSVDGGGVLWGAKWNKCRMSCADKKENQLATPTWRVGSHNGTEIVLPLAPLTYVNQYQKEKDAFGRYGWYDRYEFGGCARDASRTQRASHAPRHGSPPAPPSLQVPRDAQRHARAELGVHQRARRRWLHRPVHARRSDLDVARQPERRPVGAHLGARRVLGGGASPPAPTAPPSPNPNPDLPSPEPYRERCGSRRTSS